MSSRVGLFRYYIITIGRVLLQELEHTQYYFLPRALSTARSNPELVAAAFAAGGSTIVACYEQEVLATEGPLHDFSGSEGGVRLAKALPEGGAGRLAATYAAADAEVRADGPTQVAPMQTFQVNTPRSEGGK